MLNTKTLKKLIIITTICVVPVVFIAIKSGTSLIRNNNALFLPNLLAKPDQITKIVLQYNEQIFTLQKADNNWQMVEKQNYPIMNSKVEALLVGLADLRIVEPKTSNKESHKQLNLNDIGELGSQALLITINDMYNDELAKIYIGKREGVHVGEEYKEHIFVRHANEAQTWLAQGLVPSSNDFSDWVDQSLLSIIETDQISRVEIRSSPVTSVVISKNNPEQEDFQLENLQSKNNSMVLDLDMVNTVPFELAEMEFKNVHLADNLIVNWDNGLTAEVYTFPGLKVTLNMIKNEDKVYAKVHADLITEATPELQQKMLAFNLAKRHWVYEITLETYKSISLSNNDFLKSLAKGKTQ